MANTETENNEAREPPITKSRLEINFIRLLEETQQMANGNKPKDWTFEKGRRLVVLYGSQTGTAQEVAERTGRESRRYYLDPVVSAMDDFPVDQFIEEEVAVFVVATTGQGDDPENMRNFFKSLWALRKNRKLLSRLKFAVLGLGDSSYQKFNYSAKRINNLLTFLGGQTIVKIGLGDDQHDLGPDFVIDPWLQELWSKMLTIYPLPEGVEPISSKTLPAPKYKVIFHDDISSTNFEKDNGEACNATEACQTNPFFATLTINRRITAEDHFQDVRLIEFDVSNSILKHNPGDVVMVQPQNLEEHVEEFIQVLGLNPDRIFSIEPNDSNIALPPKHILPCPCSVRQFVKNYLDIQSIPKRFFFELVAFFTKDDLEKEKFEEFASAAGQQDMYDYCHRPKRSIMEILADFPNTNHNIPFAYLFDLIPAIRPRAYSIASSSLALPGKIQILCAVVKYKTILKRPRLGLCTNWLARQAIGASIPVWIKSGTLTFPNPDLTNKPPVIMIGPGTGCAPFRAYIQESMAIRNSADQMTPKPTSSLVMFFGCRYKDKDYLCKEDWEPLAQEGKLELHCAFSRDQEDKIYVQHKLRAVADHLWDLIADQEALIYFAGNAKRVPIDVYEALTFVCAKGLGCQESEAEEFMKKRIEKRYQTETWA